MLTEDQKQKIIEDIEWAKLDLDKGSVYHVKWAEKFINMATLLLREVELAEQQLHDFKIGEYDYDR